MTDSALPAALAIAALALALGYVPRRVEVLSLAIACVALLAAKLVQEATVAPEARVMACWIAVAVLAAATWNPRIWPVPIVFVAAAATGTIAGLALPQGGALAYPLLAALLVVPARIAVERGYGIGPRVVASWLFAVAVLAALLPYVVAHPGYVPDHRE